MLHGIGKAQNEQRPSPPYPSAFDPHRRTPRCHRRCRDGRFSAGAEIKGPHRVKMNSQESSSYFQVSTSHKRSATRSPGMILAACCVKMFRRSWAGRPRRALLGSRFDVLVGVEFNDSVRRGGAPTRARLERRARNPPRCCRSCGRHRRAMVRARSRGNRFRLD